jgi:methylated-DNA-[protein]-cysteine S-methyltransferase
MDSYSFASLPSPIGRIGVWTSDKGVTKLEIGVGATKNSSAGAKADAHLTKALTELEKYFAGTLKKFTVATDCSGTKFQEAVWKQITALGFGKYASYGDLASEIGKPAASRAVGGAVGANPVPIIVGCHRVMGSSGAVTGYSGGKGIKTKLWLLEHEGIPYKK